MVASVAPPVALADADAEGEPDGPSLACSPATVAIVVADPVAAVAVVVAPVTAVVAVAVVALTSGRNAALSSSRAISISERPQWKGRMFLYGTRWCAGGGTRWGYEGRGGGWWYAYAYEYA